MSTSSEELTPYLGLIGAGSTLELINRRTSRRGLYNHMLLCGAAISMGGIAIWSMHFVGNRAVTLLNGEPELQIAYSVPITALSFFVPIVVLLVAFLAVSTTNKVYWWRIALSGCLSGCAICGMHYLGNASINNYRCIYAVANVVGAAVIAAAASTVALALFFVFRVAWTNSLWRRVGCAIVLAGAVSGMHWCAAMGTSYELLRLNLKESGSSRDTTVIPVICLSIGACFIMAGIAIYSARIRKGYASKAQRIVLASAVFDKRGRILVTPDGVLPSEEITDSFLQKSHDAVFSTAHPLFHWMFRASREWSSLLPLIGRMNSHLAGLPHKPGNNRSGIKLIHEDGKLADNYDIIFRELFCLAAATLAEKMRESLTDVGILWDEIFATGTPCPASRDGDDLAQKRQGPRSREYAPGSLMILVRRVESQRLVDKLGAMGYLFAEVRQVSHIIGTRMQIKTANLEDNLRVMSNSLQDTMLDPGIHLGLFAVRARLDNRGFDVLVRKEARNLLPTTKLSLERLEEWQVVFLRRLEGLNFAAAVEKLDRMKGDCSPQEAQLVRILLNAMKVFRSSISDPVFDTATLSSTIVRVPCRPATDVARPMNCSLLTFSMVLPIHAGPTVHKFKFIPLQFFKTHQLVYKNSPCHAAFARDVHREMSSVLNSVSVGPPPLVRSGTSPPARRMMSPFSRLRRQQGKYRFGAVDAAGNIISTSQERLSTTIFDKLSIKSSQEHDPMSPMLLGGEKLSDDGQALPMGYPQHHQQLRLGGIMVSQEITVDVQEVSRVEPRSLPAAYTPSDHRRIPTVLVRWKGNQGVAGKGDRTNRESLGSGGGPGEQESAIEMNDVTGVLRFGSSNVEVKKEDEEVTFVEELFAACMGEIVK
ncbi:uncharacterized protein B0I36DRAFT_332996 [Microdochium trichocladiopsis]|uniref:MHYT domain-containing protein n=1 Tax=Microdochium trichocladiopsis TaxID=1682393 RepID=A0A9P8Y1V9_9PEZI|nr:uncharacterized protein B0I36DRAFT_332996 [Microdochium trichocladiopsis]KAH7025297.1 hypothetical protein B0I36DRAFT_332996 [Microdochium trichocladiopsis]